MKILYVLDSYYPKIDGPAIALNQIAKTLTENKLASVDLLVPSYPNYKDEFSYNVIRCKSMFGTDGYRTPIPAQDHNLKKLLKNEKYDLIHIHSPFTLCNYVMKYAKKNNIPTICTIHTKYKSDFKRKLKLNCLVNFMMKYIKNNLNKADHLLTVSKQFTQEIKTIYKCKKKANVIRNATDFADCNISLDKIHELQKSYNLTNEFKFLYVGRIVENKNIQFSLKALSELKKITDKKFKFFIVGEGDYKNTLIKLTKDLNLEDEVIFTGLINNRDELKCYYKMCDLFLFPSIFDTCGIVVLEAGSLSLPSLVAQNTCASELIEHNFNGFSAELEINSWCKTLNDIINTSNSKYAEIKTNAKNTLSSTWKDCSLIHLNYYKFVLLLHKMKLKNKTIFKKCNILKPSKVNYNLYKGVKF